MESLTGITQRHEQFSERLQIVNRHTGEKYYPPCKQGKAI